VVKLHPLQDEDITFEEVVEQLPEHIYWKNKDGIYLGCNTAHWKNFGLSSLAACVGKTDYDIFPKEEADQIRQFDQEVMDTGVPKTVEEYGVTGVFLSHKAPLRNRENEIVGILGTSIDITHAKKAEMERLAETVKAKTKAKIETEMRHAVTVLSGSIAHDLRTPLATIQLIGSGIQQHFSALLHGYKLAKDAGLDVQHVSPIHLKALNNTAGLVQEIVQEMQASITLSLKNLDRSIGGATLTHEDWVPCSSWKYLHHLLDSYPFLNQQRALLHYDGAYYFTFMGNPILFTRIISNLIKNALYQIEKNQRGEIFINGEDGNTVNILRFRDTAGGAPPEIVSHLFDGYKSHTTGGTGVGLAFCKFTMQSMGGDITCHSVEGDYIEFVLTFPKH
jgi:PAS domain S-box-containing protein